MRLPCLLVATLLLPAAFSTNLKHSPPAPFAKLSDPAINESSGIVKSRQFDDVYWTHNDSGDTARIFAVDSKGVGIRTKWATEQNLPYEGIAIGEATNIDWEDIAIDDSGNLLIGAFGNNANVRRDLAIYVVPEPNPWESWSVRASRRIDFHYPDQAAFPDLLNLNFDCESLFFAHGNIYLLTKHRSDKRTKLYRLDETQPFVSNPLTLLSSFEIGGMVTGADASEDGSKLAVLTYNSCWVFVAPTDSDDFLAGQAFRLPLSLKQCEAVCWIDSTTLLVTNEQGELFRLPFENWEPVK